MKPRVVIVGAGLGGCVTASALAATHEVTLIEFGTSIDDMQARVVDVGVPARLEPHVGAGLGGTTALWHNAMIEVDDSVFTEHWPFPKGELSRWYEAAYPLLGGVGRPAVEGAGQTLQAKYREAGVRPAFAQTMYCPTNRRNLYETLGLGTSVRTIIGEVVRLDVANGRVRSVVVETAEGPSTIEGDVFVLAAGGLATPALLQTLATDVPLPALRHAGYFYEDHPMAFVGQVQLRAPLYRLWNFAAPGLDGSVRMPIIVREDGLHVSFQLRPAALRLREDRTQRMGSVLTQLRNQPWNPINYLKLLKYRDDVLDILSFKLGIRIPTRHYALLMVAQQPASTTRAVWGEVDAQTGRRVINRNWQLPPDYIATLQRAIQRFVAELGDLVVNSTVLPDWQDSLSTAAHHSGTARMSATPADGVCDRDARVHGMENLYVADGSLIPCSGIANTGMTIAALALRLADHIVTAGATARDSSS